MAQTRILITLGLLLFSAVVVQAARSSFRLQVQPPKFSLADLPLQLDGWSGEEVAIEDETVRVLDAYAYLNRVYSNPLGQEIALHIAIWADAESGLSAPHHPEICYPAAGWEIMGRKIVRPEVNDEPRAIELMEFQKRGQRVFTTHWYRLGQAWYTNSGSLQLQRMRLTRIGEWPYTTKILLQSRQASQTVAERQLLDFARVLNQAMSNLESSPLGARL